MNFRPVTLTYGGVEGVIPEDWIDVEDGRFTRMDSEGDPTMLFEKSFPHVDVEEIKTFLSPFLGVDEFPASIRGFEAGGFTWELYTFEHPLPYLGRVISDFAFVQDGSWVYMVALSTRPREHDELFKAVFFPVVTAFRPLNHLFGRLTGGDSNRNHGLSTVQQLGYGVDQVLVIVHADDVGCHAAHTDGALAAMRIGMCKTGSVMVPCPDFERVIKLWQKNPDLDLGIHLALNSEWGRQYGWRPVLPQKQVPSLYNPDGIMWQTESELRAHINLDEALMEMEAQILKVLDAGLNPTHLDEHMGCYWWNPDLAREVLLLARRYNLCIAPVDIPEMDDMGFVYPDSTWQFAANIIGEERNPTIRKNVYDDWLQNLGPGIHQVMTHIALMTDDFASKVPGAHFRYGDYQYWTSPETKDLADDLGICFIGYRELLSLQVSKMRE